MKTTKAERDRMRKILDEHCGKIILPTGGGMLKGAFDDLDEAEAEIHRLVLALDHERDVVAAYQQAQDALLDRVAKAEATIKAMENGDAFDGQGHQ